jgi:hypothetical protein
MRSHTTNVTRKRCGAVTRNLGRTTFCLYILCQLTHAEPSSSGTVAFVHANVIPMDTEVVLEDHTVIVADGRILSVGPAGTLSVPPEATTIDAQGAWLMPGLADMHAHLSFDRRPEHLALYLAEGVTTVRSMSGEPRNLDWRQRVNDGALAGPTIYTSGPTLFGLYGDSLGLQIWAHALRLVTGVLPLIVGTALYGSFHLYRRMQRWREGHQGNPAPLLSRRALGSSAVALLFLGAVLGWVRFVPVTVLARVMFDAEWGRIIETVPQAIDEVRQQKELDYDFVKPYDWLTEQQYLAVAGEARRLDMYLAGHPADQIPLETLFTAGLAELAHVDELLSYHWIGFDASDEAASIPAEGFPVDYESIPQTVDLLRRHQVGVVATLVVDDLMQRLCLDTPAVLSGVEYRTVPERYIQRWRTTGRNVRAFRDQGPYRRDVGMPFLQRLTKDLQAAGVILTTGVDATVEGMIPGYHIHREIELLVESGLTPYEALGAATRNAGQIVARMGRDGNFGVIRVGNRADLVLLSGNPLADASNTRNRIGVMVRGRWYSQDVLDEMVNSWIAIKDDAR